MKKNTLIMLGVLVVLLLVVLLSENPFREGEKQTAPPVFPGFDSAAVSVIEIAAEGDSARLEKVEGIWRVASQEGYPADEKAVGEMLSKVRELERAEVASRNPEKRSIYQVDGSLIEARFAGADESVLAHLFIGKSGPGYSGAYVRTAGSDEVILARGYLRGIFDKGARGWRDRTIFNLDQNKILRFTMDRGDTVITVKTDDNIRWWIVEPDSSEAKMNVVETILRSFSTLAADDFDPDGSPEDRGLDDPWGIFTAHLADGSDRVLLVGAEDEGSRWVKRPDEEMVFKIRDYRVHSLFKSLDMLREVSQEEVDASAGEGQ